MYDSFDPVPAFATMRDPKRHAEGRRKFAHAFSATSLANQSQYVVKYVDKFVEQVARFGQQEEGIELAKVRTASPLRLPFSSFCLPGIAFKIIERADTT